jgi:PAS domain S-box-containing protein
MKQMGLAVGKKVVENKGKTGFSVWFSLVALLLFFLVEVAGAFGGAKKPLLTEAEKEWLAAHPQITIAPDPDYPPIEYFDQNGAYMGIAADYVRLVESELGISFKIVRVRDWDEAIEKAIKRQIDMFGAAAATPQRSEYMLFSTPFVEFPSVIIVRKNVTESLTLKKLAGMRVAIVSGYADHDYVVNNYPHIDLDVVPTVEIGLRKVSFGMVDALVTNLAAATYFIEKQGITNLRLAGHTGYIYRLAFGCRKDWPELAGILEKALSEIGQDKREIIFQKWVQLQKESLFTNKKFWISLLLILGVTSLALIGMLVWNRSLRIQVNRRTDEMFKELTERTRAEQALQLANTYNRSLIEASLDPMVTIDPEGRISDVNAATEKVTGYSREQLIGTDFCSYFTDAEKARDVYQRVFREGSVRDYELRMSHPDGCVTSVLYNASLYRDESGKVLGICAAARDISERKLAEEELRKYREHLEELVRERTFELARANELLQQEINERKQTELALLESERKLRLISSQLLSSQEEERRRIARELHDSIGQSLAAIKFNVENFIEEIGKDQGGRLANSLERIVPVVQNAMEEARRIYTGLRPSMLDDLGIVATISWFCREFLRTYASICIELQTDIEEEQIPEPLKIVIFRIVQEALNNIARHSRAELVNLSLVGQDGLIELVIEDNGIGFDLESALARSYHEKGLGIAGMKERTELSGGVFDIESFIDEGTTILASWPRKVTFGS